MKFIKNQYKVFIQNNFSIKSLGSIPREFWMSIEIYGAICEMADDI